MEQFDHVLPAQGMGKEEALAGLAGEIVQHGGLFLLLHTFGHHVQAQAVGQGHHRAHDLAVARQLDVADEGPVHLEGVDGKALQIGQRRIPGAEIVHGQAHAQGLQALEAQDGHLRIVHDDRLGDFQLERAGIEPGGAQDPVHVVHQGGLAELAGRHVDADGQALEFRELPQPAGHGPAGLFQHPQAERYDQAGLLGHRDEFHGRHDPYARPIPADQGLETGEPPVAQGQDGLVIEVEFLAFQRQPQIVFQMHEPDGVFEHPGIEDLEPVASLILGPVQGDVGVAQEFLGLVVHGRAHDHAHGGRNVDVVAAQMKDLAHGRPDAFDDAHHFPGGTRFLQQHHEFVPAQAGHGIQSPHAFPKPAGHVFQQPVAHVVAQAVVDDLEAVQVEEDDGVLVVVPALGALDGLANAVQAQGAVGQAGQGIVEGHVGQLGLQELAVRDVRDEPPRDAGVLAKAHGEQG